MKNLAIVGYPRTGSAKAVRSAPTQIREMCDRKLLRPRSKGRAAYVFALSVVIWLIPHVGFTSELRRASALNFVA